MVIRKSMGKSYVVWWVMVVLLGGVLRRLEAQQTYVNNRQLDCYNGAYNFTTKGFVCNGVQSWCQSYLTFRSDSSYNSAVTIAYLLGSDTRAIVSINNLSSDVVAIPTHTQVVVPVNCSCSGEYYQHNANYTLQSAQDTYFIVANNTFQGLTTCQALMDQNPYGDRNLTRDMTLRVPLRCACPTSNQTAQGFKYLLTYLINWGDSFSSIAGLFRVTEQNLIDANELTADSIIFPFTPLLVPLTTPPTKIETPVVSPPPAQPAQPPVVSSAKSNKWVVVGVAIGAAMLLLLAVSGFLFWFCRRHRRPQNGKPFSVSGPKTPSDPADYTPLAENKSGSVSVSTQALRSAIESLTVYKFGDLQVATGDFAEANRIRGSVYRGSFNGDDAAVKVMKGDVSGEIDILKKINHSNIIRLSGYCVHEGHSYLVFEYAENGSVSEWLHSNKTKYETLAWKQRVQIAYNVADALNYLHHHTNPPYVHKNLKTSNILLDSNMRSKITNFGLARMVENEEQGGVQLTRHVVGTKGYMAPEYIENGVVTPKLDVFAFGVVILELLSGREAAVSDKNKIEELLCASINGVLAVEGGNVREKLRGFMDPSLRQEYPLDLAFSMAQLAKNCVAHDLNARPAMPEIVITLSKILSSSLDWDPSDELERTRSLSSGR